MPLLRNIFGAILDGLTSPPTPKIFLAQLVDAHRLGNLLGGDLRWTSSPISKIFFAQLADAHRLGNFLGAIFYGFLHQLQRSSLRNILTHTDWGKRLRTKELRHRRAVLHERPLLTILSKLACPADSYPQTLVEVWAFFLLAGTAWKSATTARSLFLSRLDL